MLHYRFDERDVAIHPFTRHTFVTPKGSTSGRWATSESSLDLPTVEAFMQFARNPTHLSNVYYNITRRCNLSCPYCYSEASRASVTLADNDAVLNALVQLGTRCLTLIGGEPFSHPHLMEIVEACRLRGFREVCVVTNGTMIHPRHIPTLAHPSISLQVSLDGASEEENAPTRGKGSFGRTMRGLDLLQRSGIPHRVMMTLTRETAARSISFFDQFSDTGHTPGFFMVKKVPASEKPTLAQLELLLDHILARVGDVRAVFDVMKFADNMQFSHAGFPVAHCGAGINTMSVEPNGDVYPCVKMSSPSRRITSLLSEQGIDEVRRYQAGCVEHELVFNKATCQGCEIRNLCGGGCRAEENPPGSVCEENCAYFHFAVEYYARHI